MYKAKSVPKITFFSKGF